MAPKTKQEMRDPNNATVAQNRRARHDYDILQQFEAGIALTGSEIKAVREHKVQLQGAYARIKDGDIWLLDAHIAPYANAGYSGHIPTRDRRLLLHRKEITRIQQALEQEGLTLVPLSMYLKDGRAKLHLGIARGRKQYDKRQAIAERDVERDMQRAIRRNA
jgi:SsrA-binding protein